MRRLAMPLAVLVLALAAPAALAQDGGGGSVFDQPLPQPAPAETATPEPTTDPAVEAQKETDRTLLFVIGGGLLVLFVVIGRVITRDARQTVRAAGHDTPSQARDQGPHRHAKQAKAKARAKTKAQRAARRHNR
jgi:hypothetical protein